MKQFVVPILAIVAVVGIAQAIYSANNNQTVKYQTVKAGDSTFNSAARYTGNPIRKGKSYDHPLLNLGVRHNGDPLHFAHRKSYAHPTSNLAARNNGEPSYAEVARDSGEPSLEMTDTSLTVYLAVRNTRNSGEPRYADWSYAKPVLRPSLAAR